MPFSLLTFALMVPKKKKDRMIDKQPVTEFLTNIVLKMNEINLLGQQKQFRVFVASAKIQAFKQNLKL